MQKHANRIEDNIEGILSDISIGFSFLFSFEWPEWLKGIPKLSIRQFSYIRDYIVYLIKLLFDAQYVLKNANYFIFWMG